MHCENPLVVVVSGVSGAGKTTIGEAIALQLRWPFQEGDLLHDAEHIAKMRRGEALDDVDRQPWLRRVACWIDGQLAADRCGVVACSALKRSYRELLQQGRENVLLVMLQGPPSVIADRLAARKGHFMPARLLPSQFAAFEAPDAAENGVQIDVSQPLQRCIEAVVESVSTRQQMLAKH